MCSPIIIFAILFIIRSLHFNKMDSGKVRVSVGKVRPVYPEGFPKTEKKICNFLAILGFMFFVDIHLKYGSYRISDETTPLVMIFLFLPIALWFLRLVILRTYQDYKELLN